MNVGQFYILIGVAALTALLTTVVLHLMGTENTSVVIGTSAGSTIVVFIVMMKRKKEK